MGISQRCRAATFSGTLSTHVTSLPLSAKHVPATRPTYPVPTTQMFMGDSPVSSGRAPAPSSLYAALPGSVRVLVGEAPHERQGQNLEVEEHGPVLDVVQIVLDA